MATNVILKPGVQYKVAKTGAPSTTLTRSTGVSSVPSTGYLRKTGDVVSVADGVLYCDQPIDVSVDLGSVVPTNGATSVVSGATAALRRLINTVGTTAAPTLATDGFVVDGFAAVTFTIKTAGNVKFHLYSYDITSGEWAQVLGADGFGDSAGDVDVNTSTRRVTFTLSGKAYDRLFLQVFANAGASQVDAWANLLLPLTTY